MINVVLNTQLIREPLTTELAKQSVPNNSVGWKYSC